MAEEERSLRERMADAIEPIEKRSIPMVDRSIEPTAIRPSDLDVPRPRRQRFVFHMGEGEGGLGPGRDTVQFKSTKKAAPPQAKVDTDKPKTYNNIPGNTGEDPRNQMTPEEFKKFKQKYGGYFYTLPGDFAELDWEEQRSILNQHIWTIEENVANQRKYDKQGWLEKQIKGSHPAVYRNTSHWEGKTKDDLSKLRAMRDSLNPDRVPEEGEAGSLSYADHLGALSLSIQEQLSPANAPDYFSQVVNPALSEIGRVGYQNRPQGTGVQRYSTPLPGDYDRRPPEPESTDPARFMYQGRGRYMSPRLRRKLMREGRL